MHLPSRAVLAYLYIPPAQVAELADAPDSKSGSFGSVGSRPTLGTSARESTPKIPPTFDEERKNP